MSIPSLANKASLSLFYYNDTRVDFSPYNEFAKVIQRVYLKYIVKVRASVYIQKMYRGFSWRETIYDISGTHVQFVTRIANKLKPGVDHGLEVELYFSKCEEMRRWIGDRETDRFYEKWRDAFIYYLRPNLSNRRMNHHASIYHTRVLFRFIN